MKKIICLFLIILCVLTLTFSFTACGERNDTNDDSWKNKTWGELNGDEREKARDYIYHSVRESQSKGATW